jgi:hypothetical protein
VLIPALDIVLALKLKYTSEDSFTKVKKAFEEASVLQKAGYTSELKHLKAGLNFSAKEANELLRRIKATNLSNFEIKAKPDEQRRRERNFYIEAGLETEDTVDQIFKIETIAPEDIQKLKKAYNSHRRICELILNHKPMLEAFRNSTQYLQSALKGTGSELEIIEF